MKKIGKLFWALALVVVLMAGCCIESTTEFTAPTTTHTTEIAEHITEPTDESVAPTITPITGQIAETDNEYIRRYGSDDPCWVEFIENEATKYAHNRWDLEVSQKLYWTEVQERMQNATFLKDVEKSFFISQGYTEITGENGIPAWKMDEAELYPEMFYPIVVMDNYGIATLTYTTCVGSLVQINLGESRTYYNLGAAHPDPLECDWGGDGSTPEQMRKIDYQLLMNEEMAITFNESEREVIIWSQGEKCKIFRVPEGFRWETRFVNHENIDRELLDTAWVFLNEEGKIWFLMKQDCLEAYEAYHGGEYLE